MRCLTKPKVLVTGLLALALSVATSVHADVTPRRGSGDARIRTILYSADEVYRLYGFVGYHLDLEFESGETFLGLSAGDPEALAYSAHQNVLTLRPKAESSEMNLTVSTTKRRYYFEYSIQAHAPNRSTDEVMYAVRFTYPVNASKDPISPAERVALELASAEKSRARNIDYWFCGNPSVKPVAASDDGVHTRLTFAAKTELPAVFVRNDDGSESLLNFSMDAGDVVIHRVAAQFVVRRGKLTGCIVNKGFVGSGDRLKSGTIAPDVTRERKDPSP
jgi:type IV secretion system protein VirB9